MALGTVLQKEERIQDLLDGNLRAITFIHANLSNKYCLDTDEKINFIKEGSYEGVEELYRLWVDMKSSLPELEHISKNQRLINFLQFLIYKNYDAKTILAENSHIQLLALIDFVLAQSKHKLKLTITEAPIKFEKNIEQEIQNYLEEWYALAKNTEWVKFKDIEHMKWVINYIEQKSKVITVDSFIAAPRPTDTSNKGMISYIQYFFDTLPYVTNPDYAENFLIKIKRANSQRKYRNENTERVASNYMLRKDIKIKLKEISKKERLHLNETIELLIEQAHSKLK